MSLRFFIDQSVPNSIIKLLRNANYEVLILKDYLPNDLDSLVITTREINAILLPLNRDFADIVTYPTATFKGIILFN